MISDVERPDPGNRIFRIALAVSLVVHLLVGFLVYESSSDVRRVLARFAHPKPQPTDEVVTLSTAIRIEKRAKAQPQPHAVRVAKQPPQRRQPRVVPQPEAAPAVAVLPQPVVARTPVPEAPAREKHELAKSAPSAPPEPPKTTVAKLDTTTPTAPPATPKPERPAATPRPQTIATPQTVAEIQHPAPVTQPAPPRHPERSSRSAQFSEAQLEQIQHDLAKTIVQARVENNPLSNVHEPVAIPAAVHRSAIDFAALAGDMREAQGLCDPIRGWRADGWDYYYATCTIQEPDGSVARKAMPWPVRWRPRYDPWTGYARIATGPMPLPPPGWRPAGPIDPDFIPYLRKNGYPI